MAHTRRRRKRLFPELPEGAPLDAVAKRVARQVRDGNRGVAVKQYRPTGRPPRVSGWCECGADRQPSQPKQ